MKKLILLTIGMFVSLMFASMAVSSGSTGGLFQKECTTCHSAKRVCRALGNKDVQGWEKTTLRMMKKGARINAKEAEELAEYLVALEPGDSAVCE